MYNFSKMANAIENLSDFVESSVRGDAAFTRLVAEVTELHVEATEDAETVEVLSNELFVLGMDAANAQCTIDSQEEQIAELKRRLATAEALLNLVIGLDEILISLKNDEIKRLNAELFVAKLFS